MTIRISSPKTRIKTIVCLTATNPRAAYPHIFPKNKD